MVITWQGAVGVAAGVAAIWAIIKGIFKYYNKGYDLVQHQKKQDEDIAQIKSDLQSVKDEQSVLTYGILACLKGQQEQGLDGPVTDAISTIEKHLNKKAHNQT